MICSDDIKRGGPSRGCDNECLGHGNPLYLVLDSAETDGASGGKVPTMEASLASAQATSANGWEPHAESNAGRPGAVPRGTLSMFVRFNQNGGLTVPAHEGSGRMSCGAPIATGIRYGLP